MFRLTVRDLAANKLRFLSTLVAIVIGVAFLVGTLVLSDTVTKSFDGLLADANAGTDAYVRGASDLDIGFGEGRRRVDAATVDAISEIDGVDQLTVRVAGYARILDRDGRAVGSTQSGVIGMNWSAVDALNPFQLASGRPPHGPHEVAIDKRSAGLAGFGVGDRTTVLTKRAPREVTISGIATFGSADSPGGTATVLFDDSTAQDLLAEPGSVDGVALVAAPGIRPDTLVADLQRVVPDGIEVISGEQLTREDQEHLHRAITGFSTFMLVFAGIAMFVGAFIINNTFSIIVSQRTKAMAVLRSLGASGRQIRQAVLLEALLVGAFGSVAGLIAGVGVAKGLAALLAAVGLDIPAGSTVVQANTVVVAIAVGTAVTTLSVLIPARRSSKVPPIAAPREIAVDDSAKSPRRLVLGLAICASGTLTIAVGLNSGSLKLVSLAAVAMFVAVTVLGPLIARPVAYGLGYPLSKLRGTVGTLAQQDGMRNPRRSARTAASLMIGVTLVGFITIFAASAKSAMAGSFREDFKGTYVIDSGAYDATSGFSPDLAAALEASDGVTTVSAQRLTRASIEGVPVEALMAFDTTTVATLFDLGRIQGDLTRLGTDGIAVVANADDDPKIRLGDTRDVTFATGTRTFEVRAIYDNSSEWVGDQFLSLAAFDENVPSQLDSRLYVDADDEASLQEATAAYPTAEVMDTAGFIASEQAKIDMMLKLMYALLALAVLISVLGIANTLTLSIHERTRELGLLRAVGMNRAQVRAAVRWESVILAMFGTLLGLTTGTFIAWAMITAMDGQGLALSIPAGHLMIILIIGVAAGIAAAIIPARAAARTDILGALTYG